MDTFEKNYWTLYLDFLNDFEGLTYSGFSLPYLCHFRSLEVGIDKQLYDKDFTNKLKSEVNDQKEVQEVFNGFIKQHSKEPMVRKEDGVVVLHDVYNLLRFKGNNVKDYCDPTRTIKLSEVPKKDQNGLKRQKREKKPRVRVGGQTIGKIVTNDKKIFTRKFSNTSIPVTYINEYSKDVEQDIKRIQNKARSIYKNDYINPLYQDKKFRIRFLKQLANIINRIEETERFLDKISVSCIIVPSTHYYQTRTLAMVAARRGIPTICMQHGIIAKETGYIPKIATIDAVYGYFEVDWYKRLGVSEESLEIIGHPRFDQAFKSSKLSRAKFDKSLSLDQNKKTLMIAVRGENDIDKWEKIIQLISQKIDINILIRDFPVKKNHPLSQKFPFVRFAENYSLYEILHNVDAVLTYSSTVGLEAMLAKKPVFILKQDIPGYSGYYDYLDELFEKDVNVLAELIVKYFTDSKWESYVEKKRDEFLSYAYPDKEFAGQRLKGLIKRLTSKN